MAFGTHNISSVRSNRNLQHDYRSRADNRNSALKSYFSKAKRSGNVIKDHLTSTERAEVRAELMSRANRGIVANLVLLVLVLILLYSMVSYIS